MVDTKIQDYLSASLDQAACKATLTAALQSRIHTLQSQNTPTTKIIEALLALCEDPYQMNGDIIEESVERLRISTSHL